ncbi:hypothetical protein [Falsirhodobacter deserti]|uniref:hypothetical protein n=1 Tax=Falsirhodobacter deserti TaxID=1365611 RepID=UPI000FE3982B|nr:hypothetical protein [Falsirhodobacter deserti]
MAKTLRRHRFAIMGFVAGVLVPVLLSAMYLWIIASDQYVSEVEFAVRNENQASATDMMSGLSMITGAQSSASDSEVLYSYFNSQDLIEKVDQAVNLRDIWSKPAFDPVYSLDPDGTIEDLADYWENMVKVTLDSRTNIVGIRALAFDPVDAQRITRAIYAEGSAMINRLSDIAREDMIRYARDDLNLATEELRQARAAVTDFRNRNQIVDPSMDTMGQMGIVNNLQSQLAAAMVEMDMLRQTTRADDIRVQQAERRIEVINQRIAEERNKMGMASGPDARGGNAYANLVGEFERLTVDREFAEQTYTAALAAFNSARTEAGRQSRYLAAHVQPTLAERSTFPHRGATLILLALFLVLIWSVAVLVAYSLKDRK